MDTDSAGFTEFYERARDDCLRAVFVSVGDLPLAEDLVAADLLVAAAQARSCPAGSTR